MNDTKSVKLLNNFNHGATLLANSIQKDIQKGNKISSETVVALGKFMKAAKEAEIFLAIVENLDNNKNIKLN